MNCLKFQKNFFFSHDVEKRPIRLLGIYLSKLTGKKEKPKILQMDFDF